MTIVYGGFSLFASAVEVTPLHPALVQLPLYLGRRVLGRQFGVGRWRLLLSVLGHGVSLGVSRGCPETRLLVTVRAPAAPPGPCPWARMSEHISIWRGTQNELQPAGPVRRAASAARTVRSAGSLRPASSAAAGAPSPATATRSRRLRSPATATPSRPLPGFRPRARLRPAAAAVRSAAPYGQPPYGARTARSRRPGRRQEEDGPHHRRGRGRGAIAVGAYFVARRQRRLRDVADDGPHKLTTPATVLTEYKKGDQGRRHPTGCRPSDLRTPRTACGTGPRTSRRGGLPP
jgi:hypothetical protein